MKRSTVFALLLVLLASSLHAATKNNDDSCDISTLPAATLLLPYFEVDLESFSGETTLFTITNVTNLDRIARVTLWTDYAYPVIAFNIYLTAFENVLTGDYQQIDSTNNYAQSNPMVHLRAVPEGGTPAERRARPQDFNGGFPRTFYSRYQPLDAPRFDGRQPLPSTFAARWIQGGPGQFQTSYKIWREGKTIGTACADYAHNGLLAVGDLVRFDEAENAAGSARGIFEPPFAVTPLPATSRIGVEDNTVFPQLPNGAVAGWMYLNLDKCADPVAQCNDSFASQNWVVTSMRAQERYSGDLDAAALGNGCSPRAPRSEMSDGTTVIGPAGNVNP